MRYVWMPPSPDSMLGAVRKGDPVDLDDETAAGIRRAWHPIDPLAAAVAPSLGCPPPEVTPPAAAPLSPVARDPEPIPMVEPSAAAEWLAPIVAAEDASPATLTPPAPRRRRSRR